MHELAVELDAQAARSADPQRLRSDVLRYRSTAEQLTERWSAAASLALHEDLYRARRSRPDRDR